MSTTTDAAEPACLSYGDSLFSSSLLQNLERMQRTRVMCDVVLVVEGVEIAAHKVILAAASPYFESMFCSNLKESGQGRIALHKVEGTILQDVVNFMYTSEIKIREENVYAVMELADLLQVTTLSRACCHYLETTLTPANCLSTSVRAAMRDYRELERTAFRFAVRHFQAVLREEEFLEMPVDLLARILESRLLNVLDEGELLQGVIRWLKADRSSRLPHLDALVAKLDLTEVPMEALIAVKNDGELSDTALPGHVARAVSAVLEERYDHAAWPGTNKTAVRRIRYRQEQEVLLAIGGQAVGMALGSVECFTLGYDKWKCVVPVVVGAETGEDNSRVIPTMKYPRFYAAVVALDYNAYVVGGQNQGVTLNRVETYSIRSNTWTELHPLPAAVSGAAAAMVNGRLHVVGGCGVDGYEDRGWVYDPVGNSWRPVPPMSAPRAHAGAACVNNTLYVLGGVGATGRHLTGAERYDPAGRSWRPVAHMREARAKMGCVAVDEYVYALGGYDGTFWLKSVERYNTLTNEWSYVSPMSVPRSDFSATVCDGRIYCLGGYDSIHNLNSVEKYNPRTDRWHTVTTMRQCRFALGAATLSVPRTSPSPI